MIPASRFPRSSWLAALGGVLLLSATACQAAPSTSVLNTAAPALAAAPISSDPARLIRVQAHDFSFLAPETIPSGLVTIQMENHGQEPHHGQLIRLNDGVTMEQFLSALQTGSETAALSLITLEGGPSLIASHGTTEVTLDLKEGQYAFTCFIPSPDGVPHLAKGMIKPIQVTGAPGVALAPPVAEGSFVMKDFSFEMPDTLPAGRHTYQVTNAGPQPHEFVVVKLAAGKTVDDLTQFLHTQAGPPPYTEVGGINAFNQDGAGYMTLDLQSGSYAALCLVPEASSGLPHTHLGMIKAFEVR